MADERVEEQYLEVESGVPGLTTRQLVEMTVHEAWLRCGRDEAAFYAMVKQVAEGYARYTGTTLQDPDLASRAVVTRLEPLREIAGDPRFAFLVSNTVESLAGYRPVAAETIAAYNAERTCLDRRVLCHAPTTSLYFGRDGHATACCYSRANALGHWPEESVEEIWSGEKVADLRGLVSRNILPRGCETCADQLRAQNFKGLLAGNFDGYIDAPAGAARAWLGRLLARHEERVWPIRMEFELSNKCNLECAMCSGQFSSSIRAHRENKPALPMMYDERFVEQLKPFIPHLKQAKFFGGEPFLIDIYYEIWELFIASNPSCEILITTNGTVFTNKVQRVLEHLNCQVIVSLDSLEKATYESIRVNATMERTLANVERFMAMNRERGKRLSMTVCPMPRNWREIPEIVSFANARGMALFFNTVTFPRSASLKFLPADEQRQALDRLRSGLGSPRNEVEAGNYAALEDLCRQVEMWMSDSTANAEPELFVLA